MAEFFPKKILAPILAAGLLTVGSWACVSGGGGGGGGPPGAVGDSASKTGPGASGFNPGNPTAIGDEPPTTVAQLAPMPDVSVSADVDVTNDSTAPHYKWRVLGKVTSYCTTTNNPVAQKPPRRSYLLAVAPQILQAFEGCAYAAADNPNAVSSQAPANFKPVPPVFLKIVIQGQVQYNVNGGEFMNWLPENFGERFFRLQDKYDYFVDTKVKEGGKIEVPFYLSFYSAVTLEKFNDYMGSLDFSQLHKNYIPSEPDHQRQCIPNQLWECGAHMPGNTLGIGPLTSTAPNYGVEADFSNVLACVE